MKIYKLFFLLLEKRIIFFIVFLCGSFFIYSFSFNSFHTNTTGTNDNNQYRIYFVSPNGNDHNPGTYKRPWLTLSKAANMVRAGDSVLVREGTYYETVFINKSGKENFPIAFFAYPGEHPIVDGKNHTIPVGEYSPLVTLNGDYITISGFEIRYSNGMGLVLSGKYNLADNMDSHHNMQNGILITGDHGIVQDSIVWENCLSNYMAASPNNWASGLSAARNPNGAVIRRNEVFSNWGEGLSTYEANGTLIEDNIVYDNWSANVYISDATNVIFQRNFVYVSGTMLGGTQVGIMMGDEKYSPPSANIKVINNIVFGTNRNFYWWQGNRGGGMKNVTIAYNTLVNSNYEAGLVIQSGTHSNVVIKNNLVLQEDNLPVIIVFQNSNLIFSNNLWSKHPQSAASGSSDVIGDPKLVKLGLPFNPEWFVLNNTSKAIDNGIYLNDITIDFFGNSRIELSDIGAYEYFSP